jgi:hypothetical protein
MIYSVIDSVTHWMIESVKDWITDSVIDWMNQSVDIPLALARGRPAGSTGG